MATTFKRRRFGILLAAGIIAAIAVGAIAWWQLLPPEAEAAPEQRDPATSEVVSGPMTSSLRTPGTIGFADSRDLTASLGGVLTGLPSAGTIVGQGQELYRADDAPVILFRGDLPVWRDFEFGMANGPDVEQLEQNLADLGYFEGTIDHEFTGMTHDAIREWQNALGLEDDGVIPRGRVVFAASDIRVGEAKSTIGADIAPGTPLFVASDAAPIITAQVSADQREDVAIDAVAQISLPGGGQTTGRVTAIGTPQEEEDDVGQKKLVLSITVTPDDPAAVAGLAPLTAQVSLTRDSEGDVLQVPVGSLLAVGDNAFAVEVLRGGEVVTVPVETGRFASGMVEIVEGDLTAGDEVVVPE